MRVLLVDDCELNQIIACAMLARWGIAPVVAGDGEAAVRLVRQQGFDLVLMDVDMPVLNGLLATEQIRRFEREQGRPGQLPVVAYTGSAHADEALLRLSGMTELLKKPCTTQSMADCLHRHGAGKFAPSAGER